MGVIRFECDACERPLEMERRYQGQKVACPHCGDVNTVPLASSIFDQEDRADEPRRPSRSGSTGPSGGGESVSDRAVAAGYPPDSGPERTVLFIRPAMFRARPILFGAEALVVVIGLGGVVWGLAQDLVWAWGGGIVVFLIGAVPLLVWWVDRLGASLRITNKRTVQRVGLLRRSTSEVVHDNIRNLQIDQSLWQRIWGVGRIGISSSGQDGVEIVVDNLPNPDKIRRVIDLYRPL
jgi:hypothetical protein